MVLTLLARDGSPVSMSRAAASLSEILHEVEDDTFHVSTVDAATLKKLSEVAQAVADRMLPGNVRDDPMTLLKALAPPEQLAVLRAAKELAFKTVERIAAVPLTAILRGRSAAVLRVVLNAPDDLSPDEKHEATSEDLLTPAPVESDEDALEASDDQLMAACLSDLDARSLRTLKTVSRAWRRRARTMLGDATSAWRLAPEWSAGAWAVEWFEQRLQSADEMLRKRGLLALDALEASVELPHFLGTLVDCLRHDARSSHRALALRALSRAEALTLAEYADALREGLAGLEPHEAATDAASTLRAKLHPHPVETATHDAKAAASPGGKAGGGGEPDAPVAKQKKRARETTALPHGDLRCVLQRRRAASAQCHGLTAIVAATRALRGRD